MRQVALRTPRLFYAQQQTVRIWEPTGAILFVVSVNLRDWLQTATRLNHLHLYSRRLFHFFPW